MVYTLQYVHNKLILHRDLKSQNILLNNGKNIVKIGDFGISKVLTSKSKAYTVSLTTDLDCAWLANTLLSKNYTFRIQVIHELNNLEGKYFEPYYKEL